MLHTISRYVLILSYHLPQVLTTKIFSRCFLIKILYFCLERIILPWGWRQQLYTNRCERSKSVLKIMKRQRSSLETYCVYRELGSEFLCIIYMKVMLSNGQPRNCILFYLLVGWHHMLANTKHRLLHPLLSGFSQCPTHVTLFAGTQTEDLKVTNFFTIEICLAVPRVILAVGLIL